MALTAFGINLTLEHRREFWLEKEFSIQKILIDSSSQTVEKT